MQLEGNHSLQFRILKLCTMYTLKIVQGVHCIQCKPCNIRECVL